MPELREAIAARIAKEHGVSYATNEVLVSCGGKHALFNLFQALLNQGDEVVMFAPYWVSYADMVRVAGGVPVLVETRSEDGFDPRPDAIRGAFHARTKAVILNSPSNPTGAMLSRRTLETVIEIVKGKSWSSRTTSTTSSCTGESSRRARSRPVAEGAGRARERSLQDLLHDRMAHRLDGRAATTHRRDAEASRQLDLER